MRILITGHLGFVGRNFVRRFGTDHEIVGIDIKEGNDCRDFFKTDRTEFDLVIHCAALVGGRLMIEGNPLAVATDLSIDSEMFNWALITKPTKIVYFSSSAAYPVSLQYDRYFLKESDIDLNDIHNPDMTYGWAKLTGEYLAKFAKEQGLDVYVFRPFSGYGSDQDLDYPFPSYIKRAMEKQDPFEIWGDGNQVRDFIHIDDIFDQVMYCLDKGINEPINLGTGIPTSFKQLAALCCKVVGYSPEFVFLGDKPTGPQFRCCDNYKLFFNKRPKISLEDGIRRAINETKLS